MTEKCILLTNDDGVHSPGLWAAAQALSELGKVVVAAPRHQHTAAGRSMPASSDGRINLETFDLNGQTWTAYAVGGSPAQVVLFALYEIMPNRPDLVVSGINYGENVGTGVTVSGTVGAALEAASNGIPALAVSLETDMHHHYSHSEDVDFRAAAHFTRLFAERLLTVRLPEDVDLLKVEVPADASPATPWQMTRLSRQNCYEPIRPQRTDWSQPGKLGYRYSYDLQAEPEGTDLHALLALRQVAVSPLSLDMTARTSRSQLDSLLRQG